LKGRVRQVNIWRPLFHPVYDCGLCVADAQTVTDDDLIECHRIREADGAFLDTMGVIKYREGRKWYYKSRMEPDDVVLFMGYDSDCARGKREGNNPGCAFMSCLLRYHDLLTKKTVTLHSAFDIPDPPAGSPPRASIEVRLLVFTWPKEPLSIHPPMGMLTAQAPPHNQEIYASHHTLNAQIEGAPAPVKRASFSAVVEIPDSAGQPLEIDLEEWDPSDLPRRSSWSDGYPLTPTTSQGSEPTIISPSTSPLINHASWLSTQVLSAYAKDVTEEQLLRTVTQRVEEARRQYELALKIEEQMINNILSRGKVLGCMNERRRCELGREIERMAERIRRSFSDMDDL
jgi:hypothetical protein